MKRGEGIGPGIGPDVEDFVPVGTEREVMELEADWRQERDEARLTGDHTHERAAWLKLCASRDAAERRRAYLAELDAKTGR